MLALVSTKIEFGLHKMWNILLASIFLISAVNCGSVKLNGTCTRESDCISALACISGKCTCPTENQVFVNNKCLGLIGSGCNQIQKCITNAICNQETNTCECPSDFREYNNGFCSKLFGGTCTKTDDCSADDRLYCIGGKCRCRDAVAEFFNPVNGCKTQTGFRCNYLNTYCVDNAYCSFTNGKSLRCACRYEHQVDPITRACVWMPGTTANYETTTWTTFGTTEEIIAVR